MSDVVPTSDPLLPRIIQLIYDKTLAGRANWQRTSSKSTFSLDLESGRILLSSTERGEMTVSVLNIDGERISFISYSIFDNEYEKMTAMWERVNREFESKSLIKILNELESV